VRNPSLKWRLNDEDNAEVIIPRRQDRLGRVMAFVFYVPKLRPIVLDEVGTRVWHLCDGERTVADIVETLRQEYKLGRREVEVSLTEYLRTLGKRGMIGFLVPEEIARQFGEEGQRLVGLPGVTASQGDLEQASARDSEEHDQADAAEQTSQRAGEVADGEEQTDQGTEQDPPDAPAKR